MNSDKDKKMSTEDHKKRHKELHEYLDELVADFIGHTNRLPSSTTVLELMNWSYDQTIQPTEENT